MTSRIERILHLFAMLMETHTNRDIAANLLDTYLGTISGARVLKARSSAAMATTLTRSSGFRPPQRHLQRAWGTRGFSNC